MECVAFVSKCAKIGSLIFYYHRLNCYSFNALAGAIDGDPGLADLPIVLATNADAVLASASDAAKRQWPR